jgi:protein-S-isoprenylcysteine O-methyltransferase Ste14
MSETQSKQGGANVRFPPPLVFVGLIGIGVALQLLVRPLVAPVSLWPRIIVSAMFFVAGLVLGVLALGWFKRTGQHPRPWLPSPVLIVEGIYRHTRNPMYVGMTCLTIGIGVALDNLWIVALAPLGLVFVHFIAVLPEERYLEEKFGDSYRAFKKSVRRYL